MLAFCTTCKGRAEHIKRTLPQNLEHNRHAVFVLVDYNSPDDLAAYIRENFKRYIDAALLVYYRFTEPIAFQMAHAKNLAHRLGMLEGADILVNLDADNFAGENFDKYAQSCFLHDRRRFLWAKMVKDGTMPRGISGRIAVTKEAFLLTGGYDEKYDTWGPDDKNFNYRLRRLGLAGEEIPKHYLHAVLHNDKMRFREYPEASDNDAADFELHDMSGSSVANAGDFGCGVVYRNFESEPIEIRPLPTRIFGIGMHKTATTSLDAALKTLGLPSAHWENAHWAKAIWEEMATHGYSRTLEAHYALCDLPIPLLYKALDAAYPGSKFILTLREEDAWLNSVRNHWSDANPYRASWSTDPFSHRVHKLVYGQKGFDEELFRRKYREHNAAVREYFKARPDDLLVLDMSRGAGWYELCGFLRQPIPSVPYPHHFKTKLAHHFEFAI